MKQIIREFKEWLGFSNLDLLEGVYTVSMAILMIASFILFANIFQL